MAKQTTAKRIEQKALYLLKMKPKLTRAFDRAAAARPEMADACLMEYRALVAQVRREMAR